MQSDKRPSVIVLMRCPNCGGVHSRLDRMLLVEARRLWSELVSQKELINNSPFNLCCEEPLEYYIGDNLARDVLFQKGKE